MQEKRSKKMGDHRIMSKTIILNDNFLEKVKVVRDG